MAVCLKRNDMAKKIVADVNRLTEVKYSASMKKRVIYDVFSSNPPL